MRALSSLVLAAAGAVALGPAAAQVDHGKTAAAPLHAAAAQGQPVQVHPYVPPRVAQAVPPQMASVSAGFEAYKNWLMSRARREGVREDVIRSVIPTLRLNERAMQLDRAQRPTGASSNIASPLSPYLRNHVTPSLISRGQARYSSHWPNLVNVNTRYGVDPAVLIAIYGKETSYGSIVGTFDLAEALATLAYEGRRRQMFEEEFISVLKLIQQGVPRWRLKGSYAGATGYPQFMPSVVLRLRADGDGDGYADIWNNEDDTFASIANYLRDAGWKRGVPWGIQVRTPPTLNRAAIRTTVVPPRCPAVFRRHSRWLTMREWRALGVVPLRNQIADNEMATLLETDGPGGDAYLLTTNYRAILDYNCSNAYAMSIGLLSDRIARR